MPAVNYYSVSPPVFPPPRHRLRDLCEGGHYCRGCRLLAVRLRPHGEFVAAGLDEDLAQQLARATVSGSGALLDQVDQSAAELRGNVTSPGGTTEAALQVLMAEPGLQTLLTKAVAEATALARGLSG